MSTSARIFIGIFIILHGLVHPIMALVPQPAEEQSDTNPPVVGGFWTTSWLLGKSPAVKGTIYTLAALTALALSVAGIGFMGMQSWARMVWGAGAGLSLLLLVVFWDIYFIVGVVIDTLMIAALLTTSWFTD